MFHNTYNMGMEHQEIVDCLRETDSDRLERLWSAADRVRSENVGEEVHLRGLIEFSNRCSRMCMYCGLRAANTQVERYSMSAEEIVAAAVEADRLGYGTVVLQSGEDAGLDVKWLGAVIRRLKDAAPLAVTLSVGERDEHELAEWREAGADRYLLRFETSSRRLFDKIHPPRQIINGESKRSDRIDMLHVLRRLGYEVGSGVMIGIPGQTFDGLARDIELFAELDLDMIGAGPYIAHPETPLGQLEQETGEDQVPNSELMGYKVIALARLVCPAANIPSTTALAALNTRDGRQLGLARGANVVMPNVTPGRYRMLYDIYPNKTCMVETARACDAGLRRQLAAMGRTVGLGRGDSPNYRRRQTQKSNV